MTAPSGARCTRLDVTAFAVKKINIGEATEMCSSHVTCKSLERPFMQRHEEDVTESTWSSGPSRRLIDGGRLPEMAGAVLPEQMQEESVPLRIRAARRRRRSRGSGSGEGDPTAGYTVESQRGRERGLERLRSDKPTAG